MVNDTRVIPARLLHERRRADDVDILLAEQIDRMRWLCLVTGVRKGSGETRVWVGDGEVRLTPGAPFWTLETSGDMDVARLMTEHGVMPLPPYIRREKGEQESRRLRAVPDGLRETRGLHRSAYGRAPLRRCAV